MKIAYLILAHNNPGVLQRSIRQLSDADSAFFIHIDKKADIARFSNVKGENIHFSKERVTVFWAEYSMVDAILILLRQALQASPSYEYFILLSGSDYPLRSRDYIRDFLETNRGSEYISIVKIPNEAAGQPLSKINSIWPPSDRPVVRFLARAFGKFGLARRDYRRYLGTLEPYAGATWWTLTRDACEYIVRFLDGNPRLEKFFRYTPASDEMIFHTILGNSEFRRRMRRNLFYTDWSDCGSHPAMIGERHITLFQKQERVFFSDPYGSGEVLFARKFSDSNLSLIERVDRMIAHKEGACPAH
jgi:hypothetical protein